MPDYSTVILAERCLQFTRSAHKNLMTVNSPYPIRSLCRAARITPGQAFTATTPLNHKVSEYTRKIITLKKQPIFRGHISRALLIQDFNLRVGGPIQGGTSTDA